MPKHAVSFAVAAILAVAVVAVVDLAVESRTVDAKCPPSLVDPDRQPNGQTYHVGRYRVPPSAPTGVTSYIINYSPWVWFDSGVVGYSMLNRGVTKWGQIGWLEWEGDERVTFVQYTPVSVSQGVVTAYFPARPLGSYSEYKVLKRGGYFEFYADGIGFGSGAINWSPNEAQLAGEIKTYASQMPGGFNSPYSEWFNLSYIEYGGYGGWYYFGGAASPGIDPAFGQQIYNSWSQRIWDWACPQ